MNNNAKHTIKHLVDNNLIPVGFFDIKHEHLIAYVDTYGKLFGCKKRSRNDVAFSIKFAGMNLLAHIHETTGVSPAKNKAGFVYAIINPSWPLAMKIGVTYDVAARLKQYQTYSPYRDYTVLKYEFVIDKLQMEKELLANFPSFQGEWVHVDNFDKFNTIVRNKW